MGIVAALLAGHIIYTEAAPECTVSFILYYLQFKFGSGFDLIVVAL